MVYYRKKCCMMDVISTQRREADIVETEQHHWIIVQQISWSYATQLIASQYIPTETQWEHTERSIASFCCVLIIVHELFKTILSKDYPASDTLTVHSERWQAGLLYNVSHRSHAAFCWQLSQPATRQWPACSYNDLLSNYFRLVHRYRRTRRKYFITNISTKDSWIYQCSDT